jgi:hypothetical protein
MEKTGDKTVDRVERKERVFGFGRVKNEIGLKQDRCERLRIKLEQ